MGVGELMSNYWRGDMSVEEFLSEWHNDNDRLLVHTSGSTGQPKPLWVEKRRMMASARITCSFLGLKAGDTALLCLPLDYIAGKMMVVRALTCGLHLLSVKPSGHPLSDPELADKSIDFAAMIPMQVYNALQVPEERERLRRIRHLIIGGGAIDHQLECELNDFPNAVWSTYGMTETLSHIALRRLNGPDASLWYTPLESVSISRNADNCLVVDAPSVCSSTLETNDIAEICEGKFRILGRRDNVVCSGGIKIQIEEVERQLHEHTSQPLLITKCADAKLGEAVVLLTESSDVEALRLLCQRVLPRYWQPRHFIVVDQIPFTATGKPARSEAERLAALAIEV